MQTLVGAALSSIAFSQKIGQMETVETRGEVPYRALGRTGVHVSMIGLGGSHIGGKDLTDDEALKLIRAAIDRGINFMDNCWDYHEGTSETRMGKALRDGYREKVFLMTKIDGRTREEAGKQIDESLRRLQTDHLDLLQHHEILRFEDPDRIFEKGGAMEAVQEAQKAGKLRFIGFTGHKDPHVHLHMLQFAAERGFRFDTVQMPLNAMDAHFRSFTQLVLPEAVRQGLGILGMKSMGAGVILKSKTASPVECLRFAMNLPTSVVITGITNDRDLNQAIDTARNFRPMSESELAALLSKTKESAAHGEYELFKTSAHFDGTARHPEWLGGESPHVKQVAPESS